MKLEELLNALISYCTIATKSNQGLSVYEDKTAVPKEIAEQEVEAWEFREGDVDGAVLFVHLKG